MTGPDPATVKVAVEKLRSEAKTWSATATKPQDMAGAAGGLALTVDELSFAAVETGLLVTYQALQQRMVSLCQQAVTALNGMAGILTNAADHYDELEKRNAAAVGSAGQPEPPR